MKKLLIAPMLLVIAIAVSAATIEVPEAPAFMLIAGGGVEDAGGECTCSGTLASNTGSSSGDLDVHDQDTLWFVGQKFTGQAEIDICSVTFYLSHRQGVVEDLDFNVVIYSESAGDMDTLLGTSATVAGDSAWSDSPVEFTFDTEVSVSGTFFVMVKDDKLGGSSELYIEAEYTADGAINGTGFNCDENGENCVDSGADMKIVVEICE